MSPEDALDVARREVKRWRLQRLTHLKANADLDPATAFFVLTWDTFRAPAFDYDEALRLARAVGVDLDRDLTGRLVHKSGSNLTLRDSTRRAATGALGPADGSRGMIDAHTARSRSLTAARELLDRAGVAEEPRFVTALEAVIEVLPLSPDLTGTKLTGDARAAGDDFQVGTARARTEWSKLLTSLRASHLKERVQQRCADCHAEHKKQHHDYQPPCSSTAAHTLLEGYRSLRF